MAGIIANVDSDVQKLRKLKNEIENVKKALKGINITVDIDIAKGLQSQLTSLIGQYDTLVDKIAAAEGKIMLSVSRINKATEKIVQAQEKVSKPVDISAQTGNVNTQTNTAETASIQAQAKAYEDLKAEINSILGTRETNIKRMLDEQNTIKLINAEINRIIKSQGEHGRLSSVQQKRLEQLNNSLLTHKTALSEVRQTLSNNVKLDNVAVTSMNGLSQSLSRMRITYRELTEEERNSSFGKELLASINQADAKIKELDASIGNHARNVGNYKKEWNGLQYQMQMVARELPNFAINPQIGIMSLTNNLPYLADELKKAKDARKAYMAEVKAGNKDLKAVPSVTKQIISSLFSWQTALIMWITLITAYRKEITEWVGGLFNAKSAIKSLKEAESDINEKFIENTKGLGQQIVKLRELQDKWKALGSDINAQKQFIQDAKSDFDNLGASVYSVNDAESLLIKNTPAFIEALKLRAQAAAAKELSEEKYKEYLSKRQEALDESQKEPSISDNLKRIAYNLFEPSTSGVINTKEQEDILKSFQGQRIKLLIDEAEAAKTDAESYFTLKQAKEEAATDIINSILPNSKVEIQNKDFWTNQKNNAISALDAIDSKQRDLLDKTAKDPKKDLYGLGIDKSIVDSYKQAIKLKTEAEKELKVYDSFSNQDSASDTLRKEQEKLNLLLNKQALEQSRAAEDLENQTEQARINAMKEGNARTLEQMKLDHSKEMQQLDRQQEDLLRKKIEDERAKFDAKEDKKAATTKGYKKQTFDGSKIALSPSESYSFVQQRMYLDIKQVGEIQSYLDKERQSWNDYLTEYGTFQEKKEAITAEYNDKISSASTKGEKESLKKELENRIKEINLDELKSSINFADIFGDLDSQSTEALTKMRDKLKEIIEKSAEDLKPTDLKALQDAFKDIDIKVSERNPFGELKQGIDDYKESTQAVIKAQEDLNTVQQGGEIIVGTYIDSTGKICTKLLTQAQAEKNLSDAQRDRLEAQSKLTKAINTIGQQGQQIVQAGSDLTNMLTDLGVSIPDSVKGALDGVGQVMDSMASIDLMKPMSILTGITGMLAGIGKTIGSVFGLGSNDSVARYEALKEQLGAINEIYDKIIDKSKEEIVFGGGFASIKATSDAMDTLNKKVENYRNLAQSSGEYRDGKHSAAWHSNKNVGEGNFNAMGNLIGKSINSVQDLYRLSEGELYTLMTKMPDAWGAIDEKIRENLESIAECKDEANELQDALNEAMTGVDFDSFYNGFIDQLSDMDTSFEDMCDNFEEYLRKSIMAGIMANKYSKELESLYTDWSEAAKSNGIDKDEANELQVRYQDILKRMMDERGSLANTFGWESSESSSRNSTSKGFAAMSQDTGEELNGRFTALQISNEEIKLQNTIQSQSLNLLTAKADAMLSVGTDTRNIADDTRNLIANSYLELMQISENTGAIVKPIQQMQKDIAEVKKNTAGLAP